ncbi:MAG: universal stress protein [Hymenobacteraceae bacterium]|nr:universal stress protein [Hymenobacteraceae bacterium]MDX5396717.1 universal stress protein [Hymenobacteraceae bacterium]MDX5442984.1 universal stress protein [Hymenobacteraceae bacterium]MDX5512777.1 universal stress protein [Hymenobacteraceae bacterium]
MKRILVPTDFSEEAQNAFEVAIQIAKKTGAAIKLLHVIEMPRTANFSAMGSVVPRDPNEEIFVIKVMESTRDQIRNMIAQVEHEGVDIVQEVDVDTIFNKINEVVDRDHVDLIVMGSKGSSGIREMLIGSNTEKVVRLATCPVLTVKHKHAAFDVKNIVFPSNFDDEAQRLVDQVKMIQEIFDARIHLLYVNTPGTFGSSDKIQEKMHYFAERFGLHDYTVNVYNDSIEEDGILHFANRINADLVTMGTHGRRGIAHLLSGSIAEDLVNHTVKPVLTYHI